MWGTPGTPGNHLEEESRGWHPEELGENARVGWWPGNQVQGLRNLQEGFPQDASSTGCPACHSSITGASGKQITAQRVELSSSCCVPPAASTGIA